MQTFYEPPAAAKCKRGSWWKGRRWVKRTYGAGVRARTPESGGNISRSSPRQRRHTLSISGEVSRKINGLNEAGEGESSVWGREGPLQVEMCLMVKLWYCEGDRRKNGCWRSWEVHFEKVELRYKRCSWRVEMAVVERRRPVFCGAWHVSVR